MFFFLRSLRIAVCFLMFSLLGSSLFSSSTLMKPASIAAFFAASALLRASNCYFVKYLPSFFSASIFSLLARFLASIASFSSFNLRSNSSCSSLNFLSSSSWIFLNSSSYLLFSSTWAFIFAAIAEFTPGFLLSFFPLAPPAAGFFSTAG